MENTIRGHKAAIQRNILSNIEGPEKISKGEEIVSISQEEFDEQYGEGHEVFTKGNLDAYVSECVQKGVDSEEIVAQVSTLTEILVKGGEGDVGESFYIRKGLVSDSEEQEEISQEEE